MAETTPTSPVGAKGASRTVELTRAERAVARRAAEIRATVPHLELTTRAGIGALGDGMSGEPAARVVRACALALREEPRANGSHRGDTIELYERVNIGFTVSEGDVHVIPTLFDADAKGAEEIAEEIAALRRRALDGRLTPPEMAGATFTFSETTALASPPLVISPQAAALTMGAPHEVARIDDGVLIGAAVVALSLACDHRILYGARAARFLQRIRDHVEEETP